MVDEDGTFVGVDTGGKEGSEEIGDEIEEEIPGITIEDIAREQRWKPKEEFTGNSEDWVDAVEFLRRGADITDTMRKHLKDNKRTLSEQTASIENLKTHFAKTQAAQVKVHRQEIVRLTKEKDTAIEEGDVQRVREIEQEMIPHFEEDVPPSPPERYIDPIDLELYEKWRSNNPWYGIDKGKTDFANRQSAKLDYDYDGLPYEKKVQLIDRAIENVYPTKSSDSAGPKVTTVERGRPSVISKKGKTLSVADLVPGEKEAMQEFIDSGVLTKAEYLKSIEIQRSAE